MNRKLRMGMIGGGKDAFIGAIHRIAANMDGLVELVCGSLSINKEIAIDSGRTLFLPEDRIYTSWEEMLESESKLPDGERMDFVTIVTPNFAHFAPAMMALDKGFDVVVEKPITLSLDEALQLKDKLNATGRTLCLTHTYTGYPMVKQAKSLVQSGSLGRIKKVFVEYRQGWLSKLLEREGNQGAAWRTDPKKGGKSAVMGDIGTHAFNLAEYISGLQVSEVCADLNTMVDGRQLDDDGSVLLKFDNGARGVLAATQVAAGEENNLTIKVYGENGGLEWHQQEPNTLLVKWADKPAEILRAGQPYLSDMARHNCRTPGGHPEGYLEAFGNIYRNFAFTVVAKKLGASVDEAIVEFPSVTEGIRGMAFVESVVRSSQSNEKWTPYSLEVQ
ncbi:Gfo/Idh/MocA family oxidoreductase [Flavisolibacter sp. BT320]|nr:Gfo/Idh/MocA family oxidoreductase [Flavisolibacter longurius]